VVKVLLRALIALVLVSVSQRQALAQAPAPSKPRLAPTSKLDVEALVARAKRDKLAQTTRWRRLGHYRRGLFGGWQSEADGKPFFLAREGKTDPEAELEVTLRALFAEGPDDDAQGLQHPYCRFPARRRFLEKSLGLEGKLPYRPCLRYVDYVSRLAPNGVTLIFSSYYLNNPASAFGHTFLRVEKRGRSNSEEPSDLLNYGVDFSASVDTGNALVYAVKGLTGLFPGVFSKVPYYKKVREYNDYESRDLWEYELNLSPEEIETFVDHLWELGSTYFAYYYLSENCSYHVLGLLEAVNPRFELLRHVGYPVIPADTVKALYRNSGLVKSVRYRPSNRTQLKFRLSALSAGERDLLAKLLAEPHTPFPSAMPLDRQMKVLDTALDLIDVRLARDLVKSRTDMDPEADVQQELLARRAEIELPSANVEQTPPFDRMPQYGHGSRRLGLGGGYARDTGPYQLLRFRLALHDLVDAAPGFPEGAAIEFLPLTLRYREKSRKITLEEFELIHVQSVSPWTRFEHPTSFRVAVGATRTYDTGCVDCATGFFEVGFGLALAPFGDAALFYALAEARVFAPFDSGLLDAFRAGAGPLAGLRLRFTDNLALWGGGRWTYLPAQHPRSTWSVEGALRWQYTHNFAIGAEGALHPEAASAQGVSYLYF
jgi:hypothetical protein